MYIYIYVITYTTVHYTTLHCIALHYITYVYVYTHGLVHLDKIYLTKLGFDQRKWWIPHTGMYPPVIKHGKLGYPL